MRIETLYKTRTPEKEMSECFEIAIDLLPFIGPRNFRFLKKHGRWDQDSSTYVLAMTDLQAVEQGITLQEAESRFAEARIDCARSGFIHSFAPDYSPDGSHVYELLAPGGFTRDQK